MEINREKNEKIFFSSLQNTIYGFDVQINFNNVWVTSDYVILSWVNFSYDIND